jgi:hypothetical protein
MLVEDGVPVGFYEMAVLFLVAGYFSFFLKSFCTIFLWCFSKPFMSCWIICQASLGLARKSFWWHLFANLNCHLLLALLFSFRRFHLASLRSFWVTEVPFFMKFFSASFHADISSIKMCSDAENQSGLEVTGCSVASFAASVICFSKSCSSSSLVDSAAVLGSSSRKNSEAFSWNLLFWLFRRMKLLILVLGWDSMLLSILLDSSTSFDSRNLFPVARTWTLYFHLHNTRVQVQVLPNVFQVSCYWVKPENTFRVCTWLECTCT